MKMLKLLSSIIKPVACGLWSVVSQTTVWFNVGFNYISRLSIIAVN